MAGPIVVAQDLAFDTDVISLPPDRRPTLTFDNEDAGVEHNIAIFTDESASSRCSRGRDVPRRRDQTYTVPALAEGEYYFHCDVHPNMSGTVEVGGPAAGGRRRWRARSRRPTGSPPTRLASMSACDAGSSSSS